VTVAGEVPESSASWVMERCSGASGASSSSVAIFTMSSDIRGSRDSIRIRMTELAPVDASRADSRVGSVTVT
jgi:hypothetical protein